MLSGTRALNEFLKCNIWPLNLPFSKERGNRKSDGYLRIFFAARNRHESNPSLDLSINFFPEVTSLTSRDLYTCWTYSGLRKENPANSFWSRFIMKSLSVGVRSVFSEVNCLSKLLTSLRWRCMRWGGERKKDRAQFRVLKN